jgi:hypothetical protein
MRIETVAQIAREITVTELRISIAVQDAASAKAVLRTARKTGIAVNVAMQDSLVAEVRLSDLRAQLKQLKGQLKLATVVREQEALKRTNKLLTQALAKLRGIDVEELD